MDGDDPRERKRQEFFDRYNNRGLDTGVRLQGEYFLHVVEDLDEVDPAFTEAWLTWIYDHLYNRQVLDDRTRILVILGQCCAVGLLAQIPNHIRSAMRAGATKEECLEVILQSSIYAGIPRMRAALAAYKTLMRELGLMDDTEPVFRADARD